MLPRLRMILPLLALMLIALVGCNTSTTCVSGQVISKTVKLPYAQTVELKPNINLSLEGGPVDTFAGITNWDKTQLEDAGVNPHGSHDVSLYINGGNLWIVQPAFLVYGRINKPLLLGVVTDQTCS